MKLRLLLAATVVVAGPLLAACGSSSGSSSGKEGVTVSAPWARTSPAGANVGAAYMTLTAKAEDSLQAVTVPASVAKSAEIHATAMAGGTDTTMAGGAATTMAGSGEMTMTPVSSIPLPAGKAVTLAPGGYHIMLVDLVQPLKAGTSIELTLTFAKAGQQTVVVPVRDSAP